MILLIMIVAFSLSGYTDAWFTDSVETSNSFKAGTLSIDVTASESNTIDLFDLNNCATLNYTITNDGSKKLYARAWFNGFWQQTYHKNTATVKARYNGIWYYASDSAYYIYGHDIPEEFPGGMPSKPSIGFNDAVYLPPLVFPALQIISTTSTSYLGDEIFITDKLTAEQNEKVIVKLTYSNMLYNNADNPAILLNSGQSIEDIAVKNINYSEQEDDSGNGNSNGFDQLTGDDDNNDEELSLNDMVVMNAIYEPTGLGVIPELLGYTPEWGISLNSPSPCGELKAFKIDFDPASGFYKTGDPGTSTSDSSTIFSVAIEKDGNKVNFSNASHPVVYVWVKGGPNGMLYNYYDLNDVRADTGLYPPPQSPSGFYGLSHITFIYCEPPAQPSISLKKYVSVNGGADWYDADSLADAPTAQGIAPQFKFLVQNTGNVVLEDVLVVDDRFGQINEVIPVLEAGGTRTFYYTDDDWLEVESLSIDNVIISLCDSGGTQWLPSGSQSLGTYFYYNSIIYPAGSGVFQIPLCINVCLDSDLTGPEYDGAKFILYAAFEGVQVTNNMAELNWEVQFPFE